MAELHFSFIKNNSNLNAKQVLEQAKTQVLVGDKLNASRGTTILHKPKAKMSSASPPQENSIIFLEFYQNRRFSDVETLAAEITQEFPEHQFAWKVLGAVLGAIGRKSEAVDANQTAVTIISSRCETMQLGSCSKN